MLEWTSNFKELKKRQRLTYLEITQASGVPLSTLQRLERGDSVTLNTLIRVISALGCELKDLITVIPASEN